MLYSGHQEDPIHVIEGTIGLYQDLAADHPLLCSIPISQLPSITFLLTFCG